VPDASAGIRVVPWRLSRLIALRLGEALSIVLSSFSPTNFGLLVLDGRCLDPLFLPP
jgi:hypothetical protein